MNEDEYYDKLYEKLCPEAQPEPSYADQVWQGDSSPMLHAVCC